MFDSSLAPTPSPVPTVTITQIVVVPTSLPTPVIKMPPDDVGWPVLMDGFIGATLGALVAAAAVIVAIIVATKTLKADRAAQTKALKAAEDARLEDQRTALADRMLGVIDDTFIHVIHREHLELNRSTARFVGWSGRLAGMYGNNPRHGPFVIWLRNEARQVHLQLVELGKILGSGRVAPDDLIYDILTNLIVLEKSIIGWISQPRDWKPDIDARLEREKEKSRGITSEPSDIPDTPSPRPSE